MSKRFTDTNKYKKPFFRGLKGAYKLLWDYLYHDCDHAGIWQKDFEIAQIYLGKDMPVNEADAIMQFRDKIIPFDNGTKWFIPSFIEFQYKTLSPVNRVHRSVIEELKKHNLFKGLNNPLQGVKDKDKDKAKAKDKDKDKRFVPPLPAEVEEYGKSINYKIDGETFVAHYTSKGWKVGNTPMKDWKSAVVTWKKRDMKDHPETRKNYI